MAELQWTKLQLENECLLNSTQIENRVYVYTWVAMCLNFIRWTHLIIIWAIFWEKTHIITILSLKQYNYSIKYPCPSLHVR